MAETPAPIWSQPGIKRDGTKFEGNNYVDGRWCRFQRGKPQKMGGYQQVTDTVPEVTRGMHSFSKDDIQYLHLGHPDTVGQYQVSNGSLNLFTDRTPAGFVTDLNNMWQFDVFADTAGTGNHLLIAHAAPNAANIDNSIGGNIYIDTIDAGAALNVVGLNIDAAVGWNTGTAGPVSGGIVVTQQFLFIFGSDGIVRYNGTPNDLSALPVEFNSGTQKFVKGFPLRGAGNGPAVLLWSLDSLVRGTFLSSGPSTFTFDTIARGISILSSQGIVEYDGIYYWPGNDRFLLFNGVVREMPNEMNENFFFNNLNFAARQKVFGFKIPRYGEIWWCYPRGSATECTHAIIYNVRKGFWYDTELPDADSVDQGRTAGIFANVYQKPFMVDNEVTANGRTLWQHETTKDKVRSSQISAIQSFFETHELSLLESGQSDKSIRVARIEPDFVQVGDMTLTVKGRANAKAPQVDEAPVTFVANPTEGTDETIKLKDIKRLMSFRFESNTGSGDYEYGDTYAHIGPADGRIES
jgi:hypothetical protein